MRIKKIMSILILTIVILQIATLSLATETGSVTINKTAEELIKEDRERLENYLKSVDTGSYTATEITQDIEQNVGEQMNGYDVIGQIEIPKINISYNILDEVTRDSLEIAVGTIYTVKGLNQPGNTVIYGHNYGNATFFSRNDELENGDKIYITDTTGTKITYEVYNSFVTTSIDTSFFPRTAEDTGGKAEVTLATTTDDASTTDKRLIVQAREVSRDSTEKATLTDFSKAKIEFYYSGATIYAKVTGITPNSSHKYYMYIGSDKSTLSVENTEGQSTFANDTTDKNIIKAPISNEFTALSKQYYYIIVERVDSKYYAVTSAQEIKKPTVEYGQRLDLYMYDKSTCTPFQYILTWNDYTRKMNYKIGKIDDISLLKEFKNDSEQAYIDLYQYAQKQKALTSGSLTIDEVASFNPASKINLEKNGYYYAYLELDDENGKYYAIDDVAIYKENNGTNVLVHFAFADMVFSDNGTSSNKTNTNNDPTIATTSYPHTGKIILGTGIIALLSTTFVLNEKNKKYKDVK